MLKVVCEIYCRLIKEIHYISNFGWCNMLKTKIFFVNLLQFILRLCLRNQPKKLKTTLRWLLIILLLSTWELPAVA
jgi:hypothetical protein